MVIAFPPIHMYYPSLSFISECFYKKFSMSKKSPFLSLSKMHFFPLSGPAMKSQGHFYPVLLSPARIPDLRMVTKTSGGEFQPF